MPDKFLAINPGNATAANRRYADERTDVRIARFLDHEGQIASGLS